MAMRKTQSHGHIGEAAVAAKCWMHGIPAYNTAGLRANFAGSDLIVDTTDPSKKLLLQVKTGYCRSKDVVYFTQCSGEADLTRDKFSADFVVFVNLEYQTGSTHEHDGALGFEHLVYYVVPRREANALYKAAVRAEFARPLMTGGQRKLGNLAVHVPTTKMTAYLNAWHLIRVTCDGAGLAQLLPLAGPSAAVEPLSFSEQG
jgi:hypothetical protein